MTKTFDPKCYDLAAAFLSDHRDINTESARLSLAITIQLAIESEISFMLSVMKKDA